MNAALALRQALFAALAGDPPLAAVLGGARIYDVPPADTPFPFVTLGEAVVADWSTGTEAGSEQSLTLHAWSRAGGRREAMLVSAAVQDALHEAPLVLDGHRLVTLRVTTAEVRRDIEADAFHALVRLRAVTEPL